MLENSLRKRGAMNRFLRNRKSWITHVGWGFLLEKRFPVSVLFPASQPSFYEVNEQDASKYDLAVFSMPEVKSELKLYNGVIESGMKLKSISFKTSTSGFDLIECDAFVECYKQENYFGALTNTHLKAGCSGGPAIIGNEVVGILTKGNNNGNNEPCNNMLPINFCLFLSSKAIRRII